ncbi:MAG TPA: hypothetical protein VMT52_00855 [Planctomycetota bacterium]|nr:hypothetical protein [Planctomycetota bacterium]
MTRSLRSTMVALVGTCFALGVIARAEEGGEKQDKCATAEKVAKLLESWKAISEEAKAISAEEKTKQATQLASIAKECPVGSRMGETIGFVRAALEAVIAAEDACAKNCPLSASKELAESDAGKMKAARGKLLRDLGQIASYATAAFPCSSKEACAKEGAVTTAAKTEACAKEGAVTTAAKTEACAKDGAVATAAKSESCEKKAAAVLSSVRGEACEKAAAAILIKEIKGLTCEKKAGELATAIRGEACEVKAGQVLARAAGEITAAAAKTEACAKEGAVGTAAKSNLCCAEGDACCASLKAKAVALKASWDKAPGELTSMCPQRKQELMASFAALSKSCKVVGLLPETVNVVSEGLETLEALNGKMAEWAKANPEALKGVPEETLKAFAENNLLIHEAAEVLRRARTTLNGCSEAKEKKTETALKG